MEKPVRRSAEEILLDINNKAKLYTPEWHPIADQPDIGAALSEVFARMQSDTEKKYEKLTEKYCTDYFNCLEADVKPASPAEGYVVFKMSDEDVPSEPLTSGTVLVTDASDEDGEPVQAELTEDLMVVPYSIRALIETEGRSDYVGLVIDSEKEEDEDAEKKSYRFFGGDAENMQSHRFYLAHSCLYPLGKNGVIDVSFVYRDGELLAPEMLNELADPGVCTIFYERSDSIETLGNVVSTDHGIRINIDRNVSDWVETEKGGHTARWLGFEVRKTLAMEDFGFEDVFIRSECALEKPDIIYSDNIADQDGVYLPFGERFQLYDDLYFGSTDALSKKGAEIELSFSQEFRAFEIAEMDDKPPTNWKVIMDVNDFKVEKAYDISIEEVVWEYFNGKGWAKLFPGRKYGDTFSINNGIGRRMVSLSFLCPDDITPILIESAESFFIRARIRKINNQFKMSGQYVAPLITDVCFGYHYNEKQVRPERILAENNVEKELISDIGRPGHMITPIHFPEEREKCLYMGLSGKPEYGPIKLLYVLDKRMEELQPKFIMEYYGRDGKWKYIKAIDETCNMQRTGIITIPGLTDAKRRNLYGYDLYWIRFRTLFPDKKSRALPVIKDIYINAAKARTLRTDTSETFTIEQYAPERTIQLKYRNIQDLEVWILEDKGVTAADRRTLIEQGRYRTREDASGETVAYVKWQPTDNSLDLDARKQLYMIDAGKGILTFGKGSAGLLPAPNIPESIMVQYSFGGGEICNLKEGSVTSLDLSKGFISEATNPMEFSGGFDRENKADALSRAKREQKHNFHAITKDDYEALAFEASRNISQVKCYTCTNSEGNKEPGSITLVILMKDYLNQKSFDEQKHQIQEYFKDKLPVGVRIDHNFRIREPELVEIFMDIEAEIDDYQNTLPIMKDIQDGLDAFLDPVKGGFSGKGWPIGIIPESAQLETVVRGVKGVVYLKKCKLWAKILNSPNSVAEDIAKVQERSFVLPVKGDYKIQLVEQKIRR